jgi:phosphatidylserine/phosphatidylglycerophosphate/cardiolipin synthase-like enzyme
MSALPPLRTLTFPLLGLSLLLGWTIARPLLTSKVKKLPQDPLIQVYTNHNPAKTYREIDRPIQREGDNLEQQIIEEINRAKTTIDIAVQEIRLPRIAQALQNKHNKGIKIRLILENKYSRPYSEYTESEIQTFDDREQKRIRENHKLIDRNHDNDLSPKEIAEYDALAIIKTAQIPNLDDTADASKGTGLMHHKYLVIDRNLLILTTANFTPSDIHGDLSAPQTRGNANTLLKLKSPALASLYTEEFNLMWGDGPGGQPDSLFGDHKPARPAKTIAIGTHTLEVQFSPTKSWEESTNALIASHITKTTTSLDFALFVFSDQGIVDAIAPLQSKTTIRGLIESDFIFRPYSEALDMLGLNLGGDCKDGNRPWSVPLNTIGVADLPPGDLLHHKFAILDRRKVIVGSHNWTTAANHTNDESLLVIDSPIVAAHYQREFDRLYPTTHLGAPEHIKTKAQNAPACPVKKKRRSTRLEAVEHSDTP